MNSLLLTNLIVEIVGWCGSALVVSAYALNLSGKMLATSRAYILLNIFGSLGLIINSGFHHAIPSFAVNIVWVIIAVHALINAWQKSAKKQGK